MKRASIAFLSVFLLSITTINSLHAQSKMPTHQFGFGMFVEPVINGGVSLTYAVSQNIHVGGDIALQVQTAGGASATIFAFQPFFRYVFAGNVNPFIEGALPIVSAGGGTNVGLGFGGGIAYGISQNFVVDFDLQVINAVFTNGGAFNFGFSQIAAEGKWFF